MKMSEIINMRKNGATYQEIADAVGVSRQRVNQIIMEHAPELKGTRGSARRNALDLINRQKAEIERYKGVIKLLENDVQTAKAEAVKEFERKIKAHAYYIDVPKEHRVVDEDDIDTVLKEMTEQSTGYGSSKTEGNG